MKLHFRVYAFACIALVSLSAVAADVYGIYFPNNLAGFTLGSVINNETDTPGQGYSLLYDHPGVKASVFVYNLGIKNIPNGDDSKIVHDAFERAISDVKSVHPDAQNLDATPQLSIHGISLLHAAFQYKAVETGWHDVVFSHVYMTAQNGNFILVRTTYSATDQSARGLRVEARFIEGLCGALSASKAK